MQAGDKLISFLFPIIKIIITSTVLFPLEFFKELIKNDVHIIVKDIKLRFLARLISNLI